MNIPSEPTASYSAPTVSYLATCPRCGYRKVAWLEPETFFLLSCDACTGVMAQTLDTTPKTESTAKVTWTISTQDKPPRDPESSWLDLVSRFNKAVSFVACKVIQPHLDKRGVCLLASAAVYTTALLRTVAKHNSARIFEFINVAVAALDDALRPFQANLGRGQLKIQ